MPYVIKKCKEFRRASPTGEACGCGTYKVMNPLTGRVYAKHTTLKKAQAQVRLLEQAKVKEIQPTSIRALKNKPQSGQMMCSHQPLPG